MSRITHLVVPGLLGPLPQRDRSNLPRFPVIERLLARADRSPAAIGYGENLFQLFGVQRSAEADLPTAALAYLADTGRPPEAVVYHADPVHLRPDQDRLLLFDRPTADLTDTEAAAFVDAVNRHFAEDGWRLEAPTPARWYLHLDKSPRLRTQPLQHAVGRNIDLFQPQGDDAGYWQRCLNEVQMLFHGLAVNLQRESAGRLPVSGLWLHGGGRLPATASNRFAGIETDDPVLGGLTTLAETASGEERLLVRLDAWRAVQDADPIGWQQALAELEQQLSELMAEGELRVYPCEGSCHSHRPMHRYRVWRRPRSLMAHLQSESDQVW